MREHGYTKTYPEDRGPRDGAVYIFPDSDTNRVGGGKHYEDIRVQGQRRGRTPASWRSER